VAVSPPNSPEAGSHCRFYEPCIGFIANNPRIDFVSKTFRERSPLQISALLLQGRFAQREEVTHSVWEYTLIQIQNQHIKQKINRIQGINF
jgi:hypothetical protein